MIVHFRKARVLENSSRGVFAITDRGRALAKRKTVDMKALMEFEEYRAFRKRTENDGEGEDPKAAPLVVETPDEQIDRMCAVLREELADEILIELKSRSPAFFERVVVDLMVAMGYGGKFQGAGKVVGQSGDGGIDGMISEDKLGLDVVYVQAKRWEGTVGRPVVQAFAGSLEGFRARKGVMITTSTYSDDAEKYVASIEKKIVLVDGERLASLMIEHGVGVQIRQSYAIKKLDVDYFEQP